MTTCEWICCFACYMYNTFIVAIFYPFSQFCEINISLLSLQTQPNTAPNLFQRGVEYGKYVIIIVIVIVKVIVIISIVILFITVIIIMIIMVMMIITIRPISLLTLSLLRLLDANSPGSPLWTWEFHPFKLRLRLSQTLWNPQC